MCCTVGGGDLIWAVLNLIFAWWTPVAGGGDNTGWYIYSEPPPNTAAVHHTFNLSLWAGNDGCLLRYSFYSWLSNGFFQDTPEPNDPQKASQKQPLRQLMGWPGLTEGAFGHVWLWNKRCWVGGEGVGGLGGEPIQVNPSITAQLLRRRTAGRQRSEWFGIEMEERQSYSSSAQHPLLLARNLDKVDLSRFLGFFFTPSQPPTLHQSHHLREAFKLSRLSQLRGCISVRSVSCGGFFCFYARLSRLYNDSK